LFQDLAHDLRRRTAGDVGHTARRERHDQLDGLGWIVTLRVGKARDGEEDRRNQWA
jgi:hypothetical protein